MKNPDTEFATDDYIDGFSDGISAAIKELEAFPPFAVAPVVHGHWDVGYFRDRVCSCCLHPDNDINDYAHNYCPNCGAKMDGVLEEIVDKR